MAKRPVTAVNAQVLIKPAVPAVPIWRVKSVHPAELTTIRAAKPTAAPPGIRQVCPAAPAIIAKLTGKPVPKTASNAPRKLVPAATRQVYPTATTNLSLPAGLIYPMVMPETASAENVQKELVQPDIQPG